MRIPLIQKIWSNMTQVVFFRAVWKEHITTDCFRSDLIASEPIKSTSCLVLEHVRNSQQEDQIFIEH